MLGRPKIGPISAIGRGEEEILEADGDEEPEDDLAAHGRAVEGWDCAGGLAIVVREAKVESHADGDEEHGDRGGDCGEARAIGYHGSDFGAGDGNSGEVGTPIPEHGDVELLGSLD